MDNNVLIDRYSNKYNCRYIQEVDEQNNTITLKLEIEIIKDSKKTDNIKEKIYNGEILSNKELLRKLLK